MKKSRWHYPRQKTSLDKPVERIPLSVFARKRHAWTAKCLGMTQGALSKAIRMGRAIYVIQEGDGSIRAVEERPFPSSRRQESDALDSDNNPNGTILQRTNVPVQASSVEVAQ